MRIPRIHVPQPLPPGSVVRLPEQAGRHLVRVLRLERGNALRLFNGDGREHAGELHTIAARNVTARVIEPVADRHTESRLRVTLVQAIARGEKMDWILQKATELGVAAIVPVVTERTEVRLAAERAERRMAHWQAVVVAACEQCGRTLLPAITQPRPLADWAIGLDQAAGLRLVLDPAGEMSARDLPALDRMSLVVGPEGGLSDRDLAILKGAGFLTLRMGPRILRTETAGIGALAALQALQGDW
ncbi:MAG TPA: 16S rRNA (uracil(1498)-N(3))-methyltransferase [Rhodanobacteraceae bacterium]|nr:16S rRNA (uracil(1498)-N(3))-methyltransferase [Rhodanobacteraceae bacterium]